MNPSEKAIQRVMLETGMQYIQARNHLIGRWLLSRMGRFPQEVERMRVPETRIEMTTPMV